MKAPLSSSIYGLIGKKGSGKTLTMTSWAITLEILLGRRRIVSAVPLNMELLETYCRRAGYTRDIYERVYLLSESEAAEFWRHRGWKKIIGGGERRAHCQYEEIKVADGRDGELLDLDGAAASGKVLFLLPELDKLFDARQWKVEPPALNYYLSYVRQLGDCVIWDAQVADSVSLRVRGQTDFFCYPRNFSKERVSGIFSMGKKIKVRAFRSEMDPVDAWKPGADWRFEFEEVVNRDKRLMECYSSSRYEKVAGFENTEKHERVRLLNYKWALAGIGLFLFGALALVLMFPTLVRKEIERRSRPVSSVVAPGAPAVVKSYPIDYSRELFDLARGTVPARSLLPAKEWLVVPDYVLPDHEPVDFVGVRGHDLKKITAPSPGTLQLQYVRPRFQPPDWWRTRMERAVDDRLFLEKPVRQGGQ